MANAKRGEVGVKFKGKNLKLVLDFNAICELEELENTDVTTIGEKLAKVEKTGKVALKDMRSILWASMLKANPDASLQDAGDLAQDLGTKMGEVVGDLFTRSGLFGGDKDSTPTGAAAGNGKSSQAGTG